MSITDRKALSFPCDCVSGFQNGDTDPWADVAKKRLLPNGTKEQIVMLLAAEPKTISQLAQALNISAPSVYTHINDLLESELLRESKEFAKRHPSERYYEPNFPIFRPEECAEFSTLCKEMAQQLASMFASNQPKIEEKFNKTRLPAEGWQLNHLMQCLYTNMYREARALLEERGVLAARKKHANGAEWIFWAEVKE